MRLKSCLLVASLLSAPALRAQEPQPPELKQLLACRSISDRNARVDCLDRATAALDAAITGRRVVMVDQVAAREKGKQQFGAVRPRTPRAGDPPSISQIETTLRSAGVDEHGAWVFRLAEGGSWIQTDEYQLPGKPRSGEKVVVSRGTLGSFRLKIGSRPAIKVRRQD